VLWSLGEAVAPIESDSRERARRFSQAIRWLGHDVREPCATLGTELRFGVPGRKEEQAMTAESMDVARLREELARFPAETPVVIVADEEGNGFCNALRVEERDDAVLIWPTAVASASPRAAIVAALGGLR
jgi:hypothetical protein